MSSFRFSDVSKSHRPTCLCENSRIMPPSSSKHKISAFQFSHLICVSCFVFPRASLHGRKPMQIMATRAASDPVSSGVQTTVLEAQQGNQQAKHFYCFLAAPPVLDDPREFPQGTPNRRLPRSSSGCSMGDRLFKIATPRAHARKKETPESQALQGRHQERYTRGLPREDLAKSHLE